MSATKTHRQKQSNPLHGSSSQTISVFADPQGKFLCTNLEWSEEVDGIMMPHQMCGKFDTSDPSVRAVLEEALR